MTNDAHSRPDSEREEPLYDVTVPTPTHGERARTLAAAVSTGTLCTLAKDPDGYPYGSFVTFAMDGPNPVFFISEMAEHTKNLHGDPRASLLLAEGGEDDPLANGRVTLIGGARRLERGSEDSSAREVYLAAHPNAEYYIDYKDFAFWTLEVASLRYIGGYGRMSWVELPEWVAGSADPIAPHAAAIVSHMNDDHADAMVDYCRAFSRAEEFGEIKKAVMLSVDRYGFEMSVETGRGPRPVRLAFANSISTTNEARAEMVRLVGASHEVLAARKQG